MWKNRNIQQTPLFFTVLLTALFVSGCGGLNRSDKPATQIWWLQPYNENILASSAEPQVLVDVTVTAIPGLDTSKILTLSENAEMSKYAAARWADSLPELLGSLVARSLETSGRFEIVSTHGGSEDCELMLEVQEFYAILTASGQTSTVRVAMNGRYQCDGSKPVLLRLTAAVPVADNRMTLVVAAFQEAVNEVLKDMLGQI